MPISNEKFYELLAETVRIEGIDNVSVRRYPWINGDGTLRASVKVNGNLEHWVWQDLPRKWLRVISEKA
jgi:hypothetical protein